MICKNCPDYHNGFCTAVGEENCAFPVTPESVCVFDAEIEKLEREPNEARMPFPGMKWEDVRNRYADKTGVYLEMKDGTVLHSSNGADWVAVSSAVFSALKNALRHPEDAEDEPMDDDAFYGTEQDAGKLAVCGHICEMANRIKRAAPYYISVKADRPEDNTKPDWTLTIALHSPTVVISETLRKRLCEMILAADRVEIAADKRENRTNFICTVTDLWK